MLLLDRRVDETIMIGHDIEIMVVNIRQDKICLGVTAPKRVSVHRREVYDEIVKHDGAIGGTSDAMRDELRKLIDSCVLFARFRDKHQCDEVVLRINRACNNHGLLQVVETCTRPGDYCGDYWLQYSWKVLASTDASKAKEGI